MSPYIINKWELIRDVESSEPIGIDILIIRQPNQFFFVFRKAFECSLATLEMFRWTLVNTSLRIGLLKGAKILKSV